MIYVKKRDGRKVQFNQEKILNVYKKVLNSTHPDDVLSNDEERLAVSLTQDTCNLIFTIKDELSVEQIQDIVQKVLINNGLVQEAKNFITYRNERTAKRDYNSALNKTYRQMLTSKAQDMDLMRENANIDGNSVMGTMLRVGTEATKNFAHEYVLKPEYSYAHKNGDIHIHDLDFSLLTFNCVTGDTKLFIKENEIQKVVNADYFKELGEGTHELKDFEILSKNGFVKLSHVHIRKETDHVNEISSRYSKICLTDKHIVPVLRNSKEIEVDAKDIQKGDVLINIEYPDIDEADDIVTTIVKISYNDFVYDFTTEDHYFVANDIVVHNCCQVPVGKLLKKGFSTGHGFLRQPKSIPSASSLCCISIQSNQNDMYGGQGVATFEYDLALYVAKSYAKNLKKVIEIIIGRDITDDDLAVFIDALYEKNQTVFSKESQKEIGKFISFIVKDKVDYCLKKARSMTEDDTYQAMEALVHNLNTMQSRAGAQTPFSSINYGTGTTEECRMIIKSVLKATDEGLGQGETAIFPVQIFRLKKGINMEKGEPNYDLFQYACAVSAKRLFPNFSFQDVPFNLQYYKEGHPETEIAVMGCRTRVIGNYAKPENEVYVGRGNFSFTTINLPRLGIEAKGDWDKFYKDFDHMIDLAKDQLLDRFEMISHKHVYNYPFLMQQGVWIDSDNLDLNDEIGEVLKNASISIGFIGLAECLKAMMGKHHGESEEAYHKGLEIIQHLRAKTDSFTKQYNLNFSTFASPAEGLCLAGDTLVQTSNGNVPIKDVKVGDLVLTLNEVTRKVELKKVLKSGMTFEKAKVMKISFDDGSSLVCTPNHPIMVRKGVYRDDKGCFTSNGMTNEDIQWVEAKDLFIGARIKSNNLILDDSKHIRVRNGERIHRMVYEYYSGKKIPNGYEIHHINENKTDNRFENLQLIKISDHRRLHVKDTIKKYCFTSESVKGEKNPFYGKQHSQETLNKISFTRRMNNFIKKISDDELVKMFYSGTTINNICDNFKAKVDIVESRLKKLGVSLEPNHIVTSIEYLDEEIPVYDLTVEDNHNFYVGGDHGILVHNSGRFTRLDKKRYGIIEGVTDREYYTNSFHIPVYFKISAYKKMQLEGKFHELCNAGAITYIEMDGNLTKNVQAFEDIVKYAGECGISYFSINHAVDRCPICGYTGIIGDECPRCGFREGVGVSLEHLKECGIDLRKLALKE